MDERTHLVGSVEDATDKDIRSSRGRAWKSLPPELFFLLAAAAALYLRTMPPGISSWVVTGWDSAVMQITGCAWGVPHAPGYPLYTLLANLFVRLVGMFLPATEPSWRVTLWSGTTSILTLALVYLSTRELSGSRAAALASSALLASGFVFWRASIMAEVYGLNALIFALCIWLSLRWAKNPSDDRLLALMGLAAGAGVAHHRTAFILPPTLFLWVLLHGPRRDALRRLGILVGFGVLPLLFYLYLPIAARGRDGETWLYADTSTWANFWYVVTARDWWGLVKYPAGVGGWLSALSGLFSMQSSEMSPVMAAAGLAGIGLIVWQNRKAAALFLPPLAAFAWFAGVYRVDDLDSMLIPLTVLLCVGAGAVMGRLARLAGALYKSNPLLPEAGLWLLAAVLASRWAYGRVLDNYGAVDLSWDWQSQDMLEEVLLISDAGTPLALIGQDNTALPDFVYARAVKGRDVVVFSTTRMGRMPADESLAVVLRQFEEGRRVLTDKETIKYDYLPWLNDEIEAGRLFVAPTGHPHLWELVPRPMPGEMPPGENTLTADAGAFEGSGMRLAGYHARLLRKRSGCFVRLTLFWRAEVDSPPEYYVAVHPAPGSEGMLNKEDHLALMRGYLPTSSLSAGEVARDEVDLLVLPPGSLEGARLTVTLYRQEGGEFPTFGQATLPVDTGGGNCAGDGE